ncbi:hypothetical protein D5266_09345, partial [bacterium c-19]|nr:hypothetical protein [bacterium c-19]
MGKRIALLLIAFIALLSMSYIHIEMNKNVQAAVSWLNLNSVAIGNKIVIGEYKGKEVTWDVGVFNGSNLTIMHSTSIGSMTICGNNTENAPQDSGGSITFCKFITNNPTYSNSPIFDEMDQFQSSFNSFEKTKLQDTSFSAGGFPYAFIPRGSDFKDYLNITDVLGQAAYYPYDDWYWLADYGRSGDSTVVGDANRYNLAVYAHQPNSGLSLKARYPYDSASAVKIDGFRLANGTHQGSKNPAQVRPFALLDKSNIAFMLPSGLSGNRDNITVIRKTVANNFTEAGSLKVRYLDAKNGTVNFQGIVNEEGETVSKVALGDKVKFEFQATASDSDQYISAIFFNKKTNERFYQVFTKASNNSYEFDTKGMQLGEYEFALVNETIIKNSNRITTASGFSNIRQLEIVSPHKITYTKQPQSGATLGDYEFSKNVNKGQIVGKIDLDPKGVIPITYTLEDNANFEIDGLDSEGASSDTTLYVKIKNDAPDLKNDGLKAGTYSFCINSVDANSYPETPNEDTRVCTSFEVVKTEPTITFDQDDKGT